MMIAGQPSERRSSHADRGAAEFLTNTERARRSHELAEQGYLVVRLAPLHEQTEPSDAAPAPTSTRPATALRGALREALDSAIEHALARRGAPPAGPAQPTDPAARLADQLARARVVDAPGLCVVMPALRALTDERGVLELADSVALRGWSEMLPNLRVLLLFDQDDRQTPTLAPIALDTLFETAALADDVAPSDLLVDGDDAPSSRPVPALDAAPEPAAPFLALADDEVATDDVVDATDAAADSDALASIPAVVATTQSPDPLAVQHSRTLGLLFEALADDDDDLGVSAATDGEPETMPMGAMACEPAVPDGGLFDPDAASPVSPLHGPGLLTHGDPGLLGSAAPAEPTPDAGEQLERRKVERSAPRGARSNRKLPGRRGAQATATEVPEARGAKAVILDHETCARYARELEAASGPQPVRMIEQLYRTRYVPLLETLSVGLEHEAARRAVDEWRKVFVKSYGEGFMAIRLTAKRPPMVLDAPEMATRIARTHGAKAAEMLLVDGMRFDLGQRINRLLGTRVGARAVCAEEGLLWAALPTVTPVQLRLLTRGASGLKEADSNGDGDAIVQRGRAAQTLRRIRIGQRDLIKLDLVEARLRETGPAFDERMADIADATSKVIAEVLSTLSPGTLLYVFGDHGFRMSAGATDEHSEPTSSTPAATQGGASPEEVLVPAFAWLVGAGPSQAN